MPPTDKFLISYSKHTREASSVELNTMGGGTILVAELQCSALDLLGRRLDVKKVMLSSASRSGEFVS